MPLSVLPVLAGWRWRRPTGCRSVTIAALAAASGRPVGPGTRMRGEKTPRAHAATSPMTSRRATTPTQTHGLDSRVGCWARDKVPAGGRVLRNAVAELPGEVGERLDTADKLSDEDRKTIVEIARKTLESFAPKPDSKAPAGPESNKEAGVKK